MRTIRLFGFDVRYQWKQRFYHVYLIVCAVYIGLLLVLPAAYVDQTLVLLTFSDPTALGMIFSGGIVLLEKQQGIRDSLFTTPIRVSEYLIARCLSLSVLSLCAAFAIHLPVAGWPVSPLSFTIGVVLASCLFTLLGTAAAVLSRSVNGFLLLMQAFALPFALPVIGYIGWGSHLFMKALPTDGALLLIDGSRRPVDFVEASYATGLLLLWIGLAGWWTVRLLQQSVRTLDGGGHDA